MWNSEDDRMKKFYNSGGSIILFLCLVKFLLHLLTNLNSYGFHGDELYLMECSKKLDWGFVDHPPLTVLATWISGSIFGYTPFGIRVFFAIIGAFIVLLTGLLARELGGGKLGQFLGALAVLCSPVYLVTSGPIFICSNPKFNVWDNWEKLKHFD